jgi:hypothetical protein
LDSKMITTMELITIYISTSAKYLTYDVKISFQTMFFV